MISYLNPLFLSDLLTFVHNKIISHYYCGQAISDLYSTPKFPLEQTLNSCYALQCIDRSISAFPSIASS